MAGQTQIWRPGGLDETSSPCRSLETFTLGSQDCLGKAQLREVFLTSGMAVHLESSLRPFLGDFLTTFTKASESGKRTHAVLWWSVSLSGCPSDPCFREPGLCMGVRCLLLLKRTTPRTGQAQGCQVYELLSLPSLTRMLPLDTRSTRYSASGL